MMLNREEREEHEGAIGCWLWEIGLATGGIPSPPAPLPLNAGEGSTDWLVPTSIGFCFLILF
ncbi:hypothetical protein JOD20_000192 [Herpetosiphon giganteus]|nr:hypothetical protein [Herpetosiphon giganteus]